jgi:hypothetical protein
MLAFGQMPHEPFVFRGDLLHPFDDFAKCGLRVGAP